MIRHTLSWTTVVALLLVGTLLADAASAQRRARGPAERVEKAAPMQRVANYRPIGAAATTPAVIPPVLLSKQEEPMCRIKVGDAMPAISLNQLGGRQTQLSALYGKNATVIAFWNANRRMTRTMLSDLGPDVAATFGERGVAVVGIAVEHSAEAARPVVENAEARFATLLDPDGQAFAQVGSTKLPRVYLLDPQGKVLWFDIDYSLATRRELNQALRAVVQRESASK
jgi:peroxiredoxin